MIASARIRSQWQEYPLVALPVLDILRKTTKDHKNANILRQQVGLFACPEARRIKRVRASDGSHPISERLRKELDAYYKQTEFGREVGWEAPKHSGNATSWGRWSTALLVEKLVANGTCIKGVR